MCSVQFDVVNIIVVHAGTRLHSENYSDICHKLKPFASKWRDIGYALGFTQGELDNIQADPMLLLQGAPVSWLNNMITKWLQWAPGDGRGSTGFATKESLRAALLQANLGAVAEQFQ